MKFRIYYFLIVQFLLILAYNSQNQMTESILLKTFFYDFIIGKTLYSGLYGNHHIMITYS
jgi:disulfide bond formation protein DsbB